MVLIMLLGCPFALTSIVEAALHLVVQARVFAPCYASVSRRHLRRQNFTLIVNVESYQLALWNSNTAERSTSSAPGQSAGRHRT